MIVTLSKAIYKENQFLGIVGLDIRLGYFIKHFKDSELENIDGFILLGEDGIVCSSYLTESGTEMITEPRNIYDGDRNQYIYSEEVEKLELELLVVTKTDPIHIIPENMSIKLLAGLIFYLGIILYMLIFTVRELVAPIDRLKVYALKINDGNYNFEANHKEVAEFQEALNAFTRLGQYLQKNVVQLTQLRKSLNSKSVELQSKNALLVKKYEELKKAQTEIAYNYEAYEEIIDLIYDMTWEVDTTGKLISVNKSFLEKLGYSKDEVIGKKIYEFVDTLISEASFIEMLFLKDYESIELKFILKNGSIIPFNSSVFRIMDEDGGAIELQAMSSDHADHDSKMNQLEHKNREIAILGNLSQEIVLNQTIEDILESFEQRLMLLINVDATAFRIFEDGKLKLLKIRELTTPFIIKEELGIENSNPGIIFKRGEVVVLRNSTELLFEDEYLSNYLIQGNVIFIPFKGDKLSAGIVTIATKDELSPARIKLIENIVIKVSMALHNRRIFEELGKNYFNTVNALNAILKAKSESHYIKSVMMSKLAKYIGRKTYMKETEISNLRIACLIHDLGIVGVSDDRINQSNHVGDAQEIEVQERIAAIGYQILKPLNYDKKILGSLRLNHNSCIAENNLKTNNFDKIICFSNWFVENFIKCEDEMSLVECVEQIISSIERKIHCDDLLRLIETEINNRDPELFGILQKDNRGGYDE
jgi:PAS domain S-box-containing protein